MKTAFSIAAMTAMANAASAHPIMLSLNELDKYPMYEGEVDAKVEEPVMIMFDSEKSQVMLKGKVSGLPADSEGGIHIHAGSSCAGSGPHYWEGPSADPWTSKWETDADGVAMINVTVESYNMLAAMSTPGRTVVFHEPAPSGARAACGVIEAMSEMTLVGGALSPYPGIDKEEDPAMGNFGLYPGLELGEGETAPSGTVELTIDNILKLDVSGLEADGEHGVHIHAGMTCENADLVGGHYWTTENIAEDPWTETSILADAEGAYEGMINVSALELAYGFEDNVDHAVVIHKPNTNRFACARLARVVDAQGAVWAYEMGGTLTVSGWAIGLEKDDSNMLQMGVHVHEGDTCEASGGHLKTSDGVDPWAETKATVVTSTQGDNTRARTYFSVNTTLQSLEEVTDKPFVMHDSNGKRVLCGIISKVEGSGPAEGDDDDDDGGDDDDDDDDDDSAAATASAALFVSAAAMVAQRI